LCETLKTTKTKQDYYKKQYNIGKGK